MSSTFFLNSSLVRFCILASSQSISLVMRSLTSSASRRLLTSASPQNRRATQVSNLLNSPFIYTLYHSMKCHALYIPRLKNATDWCSIPHQVNYCNSVESVIHLNLNYDIFEGTTWHATGGPFLFDQIHLYL